MASPNFGTFGAEMGWVARSIVTGHGFTSPFWPVTGATALVPPLYPYLLAGVFRLFGLYTVQSRLHRCSSRASSPLTCIPIYFRTVKQSVGERTAQLAAWLWVVYPFSIFYGATQVWDYAQTSFLFALCFYFALRLPSQKPVGWFGFGILYGITVLSRTPPSFSCFPAFSSSRSGTHVIKENSSLRGALATIAFFLVITPWMRDQRALYTTIPSRDGVWLEFWAGNHGDTTSSNPPAAHPATNDAEMQLYQSQGEIAYLAGKHTLAVEFVHQHPGYFAAVSLRRAFRFWTGVWSFSPSYLRDQILDVPNFFFCTCITLFMLRGLRRWWQLTPRDALPYLIVLLVFPVTYYLSHASMDYRQPIEPQIVILAAIGAFGFRDPARNPVREV